MSHHIVILGGGISGLSCAWYLKKHWGSHIKLTILEKSNRLGGWVQTRFHEGFLFEQGPRSCRSKGAGRATLQLIEDLGLQNEVISADPLAKRRYLYTNQKLQPLPHNLLSWLSSPFLVPLLRAAWRDVRSKPQIADQSVYDFFAKRLGTHLTNQLVDPLVSGIYAGDMHKLSMQSCFPALFASQMKEGSLIKGMWKKPLPSTMPSAFVQKMQKSPLFSFKKGMQTLINALEKQLEATICQERYPTQLNITAEGIDVVCSDRSVLKADTVISTLPAFALNQLLPVQQTLWQQIPYASVVVVNLGYHTSVNAKKGFGYLIPHLEHERVLGCVWDSNVFSEQQMAHQTRLTVMLKEEKGSDPLSTALEAIEKQMGVKVPPDSYQIKMAQRAIPQYMVGHQMLNATIHHQIKMLSERLVVMGSAFSGVALNDCVKMAEIGATQLRF
jgi:oxygen-dependent protoporphyrinogen oxidase